MSRLSFRPRPLDIHKKLPIVKSVKDFEDEDTPTTSATRSSQLSRLSSSVDFDNHVSTGNEVNPVPSSKKVASEIPTPEYVVVDTYERDYSRTFSQPTSYLRGRGARAELGEFVEYDLDNEDEDWLQEFNQEKKILPPERLEVLLFRFEVLDHKARERAGILTATLGSPIPVLLQLDAVSEGYHGSTRWRLLIVVDPINSSALQVQSVKHSIVQSVYSYWKEKRERWQKPILRRLQPPPPVNDTNPYNVFRPREKAHRLHTRRMQRRENNVQSFEKLRQVRRNLEQAKIIMEALIKREERKREAMETEVSLQRLQMKYKHEMELVDDSLALPGFPSLSSKFGSTEEEFVDSDEIANFRPRSRPSATQGLPYSSSNYISAPPGSIKQESRRRPVPNTWLHKMDPLEPILLFTKPLVPEKLAAAGIVPPANLSKSFTTPTVNKYRGRIGRGGRIIYDRWNPLLHSPIDFGNSSYVP